jgi:hypothetical protein
MRKCDTCGNEFGVGDWPWCPHEFIGGDFGEEPLEPYMDEHITKKSAPGESPEPYGPVITTRGERRKLMREQNLEYRPKQYPYGAGRRLYFDMKKG